MKWFEKEKAFSFELMDGLFSYDPEVGEVRWRAAHRKMKAGSVAGCLNASGYRRIKVGNITLLAHRIAWLLHTGNWPDIEIDHKNRNKDDNRIENLRLATRRQNELNKGPLKNNTTGFKNVMFCPKRRKPWQAKVRDNAGVQRHVGFFKTPEEAHAAFAAEAIRLHGEFASPK